MFIAIPAHITQIRINAEADHAIMFHSQDNIEFYNIGLLLNLSILQAMTNGH